LTADGFGRWFPGNGGGAPAAAVWKQNMLALLLPSGPDTNRLRFAGSALVAGLYALMLLAFCWIR
jgi:hypothetical protein